MNRKTIIFAQPNVVELKEDAVPQVQPNDVQVKLAISTISSGTERANLIGDPNVNTGKAAIPYPRISGYSSAGVVSAVGSNITDINVGDRVALSWSQHRSVATVNHIISLHRSNVYKIPDNVSFNDAALFHIATFPLAAIRKCQLEIGESAVVMGLGILGIFAIELLKIAGAAPIIAVDPIAEKREKALAIGADYAFDPYDPDFAEKVKEVTNGGANVGIEVTGIGAGLEGILECMARFGRVALLGCTRNRNFTIDYYAKVHAPGITLVGAHTDARPLQESAHGWWTQDDDMKAMIKLHAMGRLKLSELVDEIHSPNECVEVYQRLINEKSFPLVQFDWSLLK